MARESTGGYPKSGCRVGDDAILIDTRTGEILQVICGVFW